MRGRNRERCRPSCPSWSSRCPQSCTCNPRRAVKMCLGRDPLSETHPFQLAMTDSPQLGVRKGDVALLGRVRRGGVFLQSSCNPTVDNPFDDRCVQAWAPYAIQERLFDHIALPVSVSLMLD